MHFFSRGKILLSGEYLVLFGAKALAVPSRFGQHLRVRELPGEDKIHINSRLNDTEWFSCLLGLPGLEVLETTSQQVSDFVRQLLQAAAEMKPGYFSAGRGYELVSELEFDTRWGLGSSSSLISNLAFWLEIDPYELFWKVSPGSGFDIACARASQPLFYRLLDARPNVEEANFDPPFRDNLFFVYLGKKQDSQYSVKDFRKRYSPDEKVISKISRLSENMVSASNLEEFSMMLTEHEAVMSDYLGMPTVKSLRFPGFRGAMKSLGAWGGDLVLVSWQDGEDELRKYFGVRGLHLVFRYDDLII
jgi:mevalonate kinase